MESLERWLYRDCFGFLEADGVEVIRGCAVFSSRKHTPVADVSLGSFLEVGARNGEVCFVLANGHRQLDWLRTESGFRRGLSVDERLRRRIRKSVRVRHRLAGDLVANIEAVTQMDVVLQSLAPTLVGKLQCEGHGCVVERKGRCARHRSRHIGNAIMNHTIDHKGRIGMRRRPRRFGTSALVDGDVDEHGALLHRL